MSFQPGKWGGGLHAVERGFFPVSGTGYRSLSGVYGAHGEDAAVQITPDFLEALAVNQDRERRSVLARVARLPLPGPDPLSNYVSASIDADKALEDGFFAPEAERAEMWAGAFRLFSLIDTDPRFQPSTTGPVWTAAQCAEAVTRAREALAYLRQLATGDFPAGPLRRYLSTSAYFALPPKPDGERPVPLPTLTAEFELELSSALAPHRASAPASPSVKPAESREDTQQLPLL